MTQEDKIKQLAGAKICLLHCIESEPRLMGEPTNIMLGCIYDMLENITDCINGKGFDPNRMLINLGQIGSQTTKAPEFWKWSK